MERTRRRTVGGRGVLILGTATATAATAALLATAGPAAAMTPAAPARVPTTSATVTGVNWPQFRFDAPHLGVTSENRINAGNVSTLAAGWTATTGQAADSSPAVVRNPASGVVSVYVGDLGGVMHAYDAASGAQEWSFKAGGSAAAIYSSPAVFDGVVYFAADTGVVYALKASTGELVCSFSTGKRVQASPTVVADPDGSGPLVYVGSEADGGEWAIYGAGNTHGQCSKDWFFDHFPVAPGGTWSSAAYGTDAAGEHLVVFGSKDDDDSVYALDAATGALVWRYRTSDQAEQDVGASPLISAPGVNGISEGAVYVEGKDRVVYALDLATGVPLWRFKIATVSSKTGLCASSAALVGGTLVVGSNVGVLALDAVTGALEWNALTGSEIASSPAVSGKGAKAVAFVAGFGGGLDALGVSTGAVLWSATTPAGFYASPAVSQGTLFDMDLDGELLTYAPS